MDHGRGTLNLVEHRRGYGGATAQSCDSCLMERIQRLQPPYPRGCVFHQRIPGTDLAGSLHTEPLIGCVEGAWPGQPLARSALVMRSSTLLSPHPIPEHPTHPLSSFLLVLPSGIRRNAASVQNIRRKAALSGPMYFPRRKFKLAPAGHQRAASVGWCKRTRAHEWAALLRHPSQ